MTILIDELQKQAVNGHVFFADQRASVSELIDKAMEIRQRHPQLYNQKIALTYTQLEEFLIGLIAFDGFCSAIYLCPCNLAIPQIEGLQIWPIAHVVNNSYVSEHLTATSWYMATSGTTGEPKWYAHSLEALTASTKHSAKLQTLCWALLYQPFRFAGLQVVLQALLSGADLVDAAEREPLAQVDLMLHHKVTAMSATPSLWRQLLMTNKLSELSLTHITLGGEIADQSLLDHLRILFPLANIRHIYASTEAGVGFIVTDGKAGFPIDWLTSNNLAVAIKISADQHLLVKPKVPLSASSTSDLLIDAQGYMDTQDKVKIVGERVLFLGRATGTINVGGNKVHPEKVEQVLLSCADISQVRVYGKKNPLLGELVVADVVLVAHADPIRVKQETLKICKNKLQRTEIPTKISVVENIAHDPSGKLNRKLN